MAYPDRFGSTQDQRKGLDPYYIRGYGYSSPANDPKSSLTPEADWRKRFGPKSTQAQSSPSSFVSDVQNQTNTPLTGSEIASSGAFVRDGSMNPGTYEMEQIAQRTTPQINAYSLPSTVAPPVATQPQLQTGDTSRQRSGIEAPNTGRTSRNNLGATPENEWRKMFPKLNAYS